MQYALTASRNPTALLLKRVRVLFRNLFKRCSRRNVRHREVACHPNYSPGQRWPRASLILRRAAPDPISQSHVAANSVEVRDRSRSWDVACPRRRLRLSGRLWSARRLPCPIWGVDQRYQRGYGGFSGRRSGRVQMFCSGWCERSINRGTCVRYGQASTGG